MARKRKHFKNNEVFKNQLEVGDIYSITYQKMNVVAKVIKIDIKNTYPSMECQCIMSTNLEWINVGSIFLWGLCDDDEKITKL